MPLKAFFQFSTTAIKSVADTQICDMGMTLVTTSVKWQDVKYRCVHVWTLRYCARNESVLMKLQ